MSEVFEFNRAILRRPGVSVVKGLRAGGGPDPEFADVVAEHAGYAAALAGAGLELTMLDPLEAFPDAIFVEDPALVFPEGAIILKPGAPSREVEGEFLRSTLNALFDQVLDLPRGYADGGDVLVMPDKALIGLSARTTREGAEALIEALAVLGYRGEVAATPAEVLHLKTASSLLDAETVLSTRALAATGIFAGYRVIEVPEGEEGGANVLRVNDRVIAGAGYPRILELLDQHGLNVEALQNAAIAAIDAGFTCMSLRWKLKA
ncbi:MULTISPECIES: arginine deiminase family protein [unclassified Novosphingobium]|uniref:arginine deiminase family protein n=1 Tax=unclassified Novosphingobium TaxID=2644732 RepID=UPI0025D39A39|nr:MULTISPECIES: arginine deiminase family protein [unclassified Novosphingobium]HQV03854.1 arginine deiminase family protein [Novosphingobium sp.]